MRAREVSREVSFLLCTFLLAGRQECKKLLFFIFSPLRFYGFAEGTAEG
jgi:hypothetical protein